MRKHCKFLFTLIFCLFTAICFYSCEKTKPLDGTIWTGKTTIVDSYYGHYYNTEINIAFKEDNADIRLLVNCYGDITPIKGKSTYVCDKNNLSIKTTWNNDWYLLHNTNWVGTFEKNTMTLKDVFGKTVEFAKQ